MKVLKNNYKNVTIEENVKEINPYPRRHICDECRSELEYEESDLRMGALGCMYLDCPCCGYGNMIDGNENAITLTAYNVEFPTHFFHTSKENGAVDCCDNENVKEQICRGINFLRKNRKQNHWMTQFGNLYINIAHYDGDECYEVIVSNNYYDTSIPFEDVDY